MTITLNGTTGMLSYLSLDGRAISVDQNMEYYIGHAGNNQVFANRSSGAYIFRPKTQDSVPITERVNVTVHKGITN